MEHHEFAIGTEFTCSDKSYRVTDIGTRVIVAIRVDSARKTTAYEDGRRESVDLNRAEAEAIGWFDGPPYGVVEHVFDEDDMQICELA